MDSRISISSSLSKADRQKIFRRYLLVFANTEKKQMAENLNISERSLGRLISGETTTPNEKTARKMAELCERGEELAGLDDEALANRAEELRIAREEYQLQFALYTIEGLEEKEIPTWYAHARDETLSGNYESAYKLLYRYINSELESESIPERTKPYVLANFGVCCYYTGRIKQALEVYTTAQNISSNTSAYFKKGNLTMLALSNMRLGNEERAFECIEESLDIDRGFRHSLFNALCVCSIFRNRARLLHWTGRVYESASREFDIDDLSYFVSKLKNDEDLEWFRKQDEFESFLESFEELLQSAQKQTNRASM